jgi:hypothetical protein
MPKYIQTKMAEYFNCSVKKRKTVFQIDGSHQAKISQLCIALKFTPRQMNEFFRIFSHFCIMKEGDHARHPSQGFLLAGVIYTALNIYDESLSRKARNGSLEYQELLEILDKLGLFASEYSYGDSWWSAVLAHIMSTSQNYQNNFDYYSNFNKERSKDDESVYSKRNEINIENYFIGIYPKNIEPNDSTLQQASRLIDECRTFFD